VSQKQGSSHSSWSRGKGYHSILTMKVFHGENTILMLVLFMLDGNTSHVTRTRFITLFS